MRRPPVRASLLVLAAAGCAFGGPATVPLRGDVPETVAIWPLVAPPFAAERELLLHGLDAAAGARGYRIVTYAVGEQLLNDAQLLAADADVTRAGQVLRADAVLMLHVREFTASGERPLQQARWDLEWRLESTRGGGVVWSFPHHGSWRPSQYQDDPSRALDADPEIVPIGGRSVSSFRDRGDLVAWLHRLAMSHLPERER